MYAPAVVPGASETTIPCVENGTGSSARATAEKNSARARAERRIPITSVEQGDDAGSGAGRLHERDHGVGALQAHLLDCRAEDRVVGRQCGRRAGTGAEVRRRRAGDAVAATGRESRGRGGDGRSRGGGVRGTGLDCPRTDGDGTARRGSSDRDAPRLRGSCLSLTLVDDGLSRCDGRECGDDDGEENSHLLVSFTSLRLPACTPL